MMDFATFLVLDRLFLFRIHPLLPIVSYHVEIIMEIRPLDEKEDADALWRILEPVIRAGETYALPKDWSRDEALRYWCAPSHRVWIAEENDRILGTYFLQANQLGGGDHVANAGFITDRQATGRGIATALCAHALQLAASLGFKAMQFNFVVGTNERAVALWKKLGFAIVGTLPKAFRHPARGFVDVYVMYRQL
jgi:GNAT superfamily N-acetyltransferase